MEGPERRDGELLAVIGTALEFAAARAGGRLVCRPGCDECCIGPFPINMLDGWRLRRGLAELESADPERAARVRRRALRTAAQLAPHFPGDPRTGLLDDDEAAEERFAARFAGVPCPALDPVSRTCDLYRHRPVTCRTFGPPVRFGGTPLPPCRLCFRGSTPEEIEDCRAVIDVQGVEDAILTAMEAAGAPKAQTVVAFALACPGDPPHARRQAKKRRRETRRQEGKH